MAFLVSGVSHLLTGIFGLEIISLCIHAASIVGLVFEKLFSYVSTIVTNYFELSFKVLFRDDCISYNITSLYICVQPSTGLNYIYWTKKANPCIWKNLSPQGYVLQESITYMLVGLFSKKRTKCWLTELGVKILYTL